MEYLYLSAIIGLCFFNLWCYRRGLNDGLTLSQGKAIDPIQSPVKTVLKNININTQAKDAKKSEDLLSIGLSNLMSYDGSPQPQPKEGEK